MTRAIALLLGIITASAAVAEDHASGHALYHSDFYSGLKIPGTDRSCCNDKDCRPVKHRVTAHGVEMLAYGRWFMPPKERTMTKVTPDGGAHLCAAISYDGTPYTFCAILPFTGY